MITITNGQITITVPSSAYRTTYRASGFHPIEDEKSTVAPADTFPGEETEMPGKDSYTEETENLSGSNEYDEALEEMVDLSEIPLSEMDFYQLCDYADQLGLDRRGIRSKKELRALIRDNI